MERVDGGGPPVLADIVHLYQDDFFTEIRGLLDDVDLALVNLEADPSAREPLYDAYARFHAVSGLSGLLQENVGMRVAQASEDMIETVRKYRSTSEPQVINHLVQSARFLRKIATDVNLSGNSRFTGEVGQHLASMNQTRSDLMMEVRQTLEHETRIGEILIREGAMEASEVEAVLSQQRASPGKTKFGELLLRDKRVEASDVIRAIRMQKLRVASASDPAVRVPLDRMDELIHLVDEARLRCNSLLGEATLRFGNKDRFTGESAGMADRLEDLRNVLSALRMVPLQGLFARLTQTMGSLLEEKHRNVRFTTLGESTVVDKELADRLFAPMAELLKRFLSSATPEDPEEALGLMELVAYREKDGLHIDVTGDGTCELHAVCNADAQEQLNRQLGQIGGWLQMDDGKGAGIRARMLFPEREGTA